MDDNTAHLKALENLANFLTDPREKFSEADVNQARKLGEAVGLTAPVVLPESVRQEITAHAKEMGREMARESLNGGTDSQHVEPATHPVLENSSPNALSPQLSGIIRQEVAAHVKAAIDPLVPTKSTPGALEKIQTETHDEAEALLRAKGVEPAKPGEPGFLTKIYAKLQQAQVNAVEYIGGKEAANLTEASIKAGSEGKYLEGAKLGFHADAEIAGHILDEAKIAVTKLQEFGRNHLGAEVGSVGGVVGMVAGHEIQKAVTGGQDVKQHDGAPVTPASPVIQTNTPKR